jgi:hypothetical protein
MSVYKLCIFQKLFGQIFPRQHACALIWGPEYSLVTRGHVIGLDVLGFWQ